MTDKDFLIDLCKRAAGMVTDDFTIKSKDEHGDLVTNFDTEIEKFIIAELNRAYPDFGIISEEFNPNAKVGKNYFTIDPIDGTVNFANGFPIWSVQVAMVRGGRTVLSVIHAPKLNETYHADETGAYLNGKKIHVSNRTIQQGISCVRYEPMDVLKHSGILSDEKRYFNSRRIFCASVEHAWLACGRLVLVALPNQGIWDYLAGAFLVEKAGGFTRNDGHFCLAANNKKLLDIFPK